MVDTWDMSGPADLVNEPQTRAPTEQGTLDLHKPLPPLQQGNASVLDSMLSKRSADPKKSAPPPPPHTPQDLASGGLNAALHWVAAVMTAQASLFASNDRYAQERFETDSVKLSSVLQATADAVTKLQLPGYLVQDNVAQIDLALANLRNHANEWNSRQVSNHVPNGAPSVDTTPLAVQVSAFHAAIKIDAGATRARAPKFANEYAAATNTNFAALFEVLQQLDANPEVPSATSVITAGVLAHELGALVLIDDDPKHRHQQFAPRKASLVAAMKSLGISYAAKHLDWSPLRSQLETLVDKL